MRARKLAAVALLSVVLALQGMPEQAVEASLGNPADSCAAKELGATEGAICRQFSLFGLRFTPKVVRIKVNVPKGTTPGTFPGGTSVKIFWRNGDRVDHHIDSFVARDTDGNIIAFRDFDSLQVDDVACGGTCAFSYDSGLLAARPAPIPGKKRDPGANPTAPVIFDRPGTYNFQCIIHPSMVQTVVIATGQKFK